MSTRFILPFADVGKGITPSDGAKLFFFESGTSTPKDTFSDQLSTPTPNSNPVIADANGVFGDIFIEGSYKAVLKDKNDVQTWEADPVISGDLVFASTTNKNKATVAAMTADTTAAIGDFYSIEDYATGNNSGVLFFKAVTAGTGTADGGSYIDHDTLSVQFEQAFPSKINVKMFGAVGSGGVDDREAIVAAMAYAQTNLDVVRFPPGDYAFSTQITITGDPVSFEGDAWASWQQGSTLPSVTLSWTGGSVPMFSCNTSNVHFTGMAVQNKGTATDFIEYTSGAIRYFHHKMSFLVGTGASAFSRSIIRSSGNRLGYSKFTSIYCLGAAPKYIDIDGQSTPNGITPIYIGERSIFESGASQPMTVVYIKDEILDMLTIENSTFNQQGGELTVVDTTDTPASSTIRNFIFQNNEWDYTIASASTDRMLKLENVDAAYINNNNLQMGGLATSLVDLVNTNLASFEGNWGRAIGSYVIDSDANSSVNIGRNEFDVSNVPRVVNDAAEGVIITIPWTAGNVFIVGEKVPANVHSTQVIEPTSGSGWTLTFRHGSLGYFVPGQILTIQLKNTSGGAISPGTPVSAIKTAGALVAPADGFSRFYTFVRTPGGLMEISRSAADVANI